MKWEDLEPGDVLEYTDEYVERVIPRARLPIFWTKNRIFHIRKIEISTSTIRIYLIGNNYPVPIERETGIDTEFSYLYKGPIFKIKELV